MCLWCGRCGVGPLWCGRLRPAQLRTTSAQTRSATYRAVPLARGRVVRPIGALSRISCLSAPPHPHFASVCPAKPAFRACLLQASSRAENSCAVLPGSSRAQTGYATSHPVSRARTRYATYRRSKSHFASVRPAAPAFRVRTGQLKACRRHLFPEGKAPKAPSSPAPPAGLPPQTPVAASYSQFGTMRSPARRPLAD